MKTTQTNLDLDILAKINRISKDNVIYVDHTLGDDNNDGRTSQTALKTFKKAVSRINAKTINYSVIYARSGVYDEPLILYDFAGTLYITPISADEGTIQFTNTSATNVSLGIYSPLYVGNTNGTVYMYKVELNGKNMSAEHRDKLISLAYITNAANVTFNSCVIDGEELKKEGNKRHPVGIYALVGSSAHAYATTIKNLGIPLYANTTSIITSGYSTFINITDGYAAVHGGIVTGNRMVSDDPLTTKIGKAEYSIGYSIDDINEGAIIEVGVTENGRYYKYNNGLLICVLEDVSFGAANISIGVGNMAKTAKYTWTFPHMFIYAPCVTGISLGGAGYSWLALDDLGIQKHNAPLVLISTITNQIVNSASLQAVGRWK